MATNNNTSTSSWGTSALDHNMSAQSKQELNHMVEDKKLETEDNTVIEITDLPKLQVNNSARQEVANNNNDLFQRGVLTQSQPTQGNIVDILQGSIQQPQEVNQPPPPSSPLLIASSISESSLFLAPSIPVITPPMVPIWQKNIMSYMGTIRKFWVQW